MAQDGDGAARAGHGPPPGAVAALGDEAGTAEGRRLAEDAAGATPWRHWGGYVALRQWGTVREDYSADGDAWRSFPFDHARSRAYRWGEDGLAAICDRWQHLCFGVALWNERDPILKERLFGLTNGEGNHGEDAKEHWWPLDATPTSSFLRWRYRYPHARFPYEQLREGNAARGRADRELDLADTGVLDDGRFFDVDVTYAKAAPDDLCIRIDVVNHGPDAAPLHVLPTAWFRNTWSWGRDDRHPTLRAGDDGALRLEHATLGRWTLVAEGDPTWLVCDNESNAVRLWGARPEDAPRWPKDGIGDHVVHGAATVNPDGVGTKASAWYRLDLPAGGTRTLRLRLASGEPPEDRDAALGADHAAVVAARAEEADAYYAAVLPAVEDPEAATVRRRAIAGLIWTEQYYRFHVDHWLDGDPAGPPPPSGRGRIRNGEWRHLANTDVISMPDAWEYPWYAAWDLAFHAVAFADVDARFAKEQLLLLCREWYMHPNGQLPAYEWAFDDVNPPVHAWAALQVFRRDAERAGRPDFDFLERVFHKLLLNFTWWVNRKDPHGDNVFGGGFLGLDNIGLFDRSKALPSGGRLEQADGTSWMAMYCLDLLRIALELADHDPVYEDVATKFFEHFLAIAHALNSLGLWDDADGFFYDVLTVGERDPIPLKVRSAVGFIPLFAAATIERATLERLPDFAARVRWFLRHRPDLCSNVFGVDGSGEGGRLLLAAVSPSQLRRVLARVLDPEELLSPYGVRSMSRAHLRHPVVLDLDGARHEVGYEPGESQTGLFGGNSNWRGPVWFPLNHLLLEALATYRGFLGDGFRVAFPTGAGADLPLDAVADELARRLVRLFVPGGDGRRPCNGGRDLFDLDPRWRDAVPFHEYFHADTGEGLGASQQTGWTALVATLISRLTHAASPAAAPSSS